jgi:5-methylcytosine-specific restriction endonuclease McrA
VAATFGHRCAYCLSAGPLTIDHMHPLGRGGVHAADNILPACPKCNNEKGNRTLLEFVCNLPMGAA